MTFEATDLLALIQSPDWVPDQWRAVRPFTRLRQAGIDARWAWGDDHQILQSDPETTVLVLPRQTATDTDTIDRYLAERRPLVRAIVYDCDDVLWGQDMLEHLTLSDFTQGRTVEQLLHEGEMARYFMQQCDGVTTASEPLAELVRQFVDVPVICVPNAIDTRWFRCQMAARAPWQAEGRVTIGWCGGRRPERDVEQMAVAWGRIARRYPHVRFVVAAPVIPDVIYREVEDIDQIIRLPWVSWEDAPVLYQTDIGCCTVADTQFSRCKTPIKAMEYATAGAAVIGSRALYGNIALLLADTADEWEWHLSGLIENDDSRVHVARTLTREVERRYSLDANLMNWPIAYRAIVEARERVRA
jgi:glycosyltransferase involved in cell wall biosynthesis